MQNRRDKPTLDITMLICEFHPVIGGAEDQALALSRKLIERGHRVRVVTMRLPGTESFEKVEGVPVRRLSSLRKGVGPLLYVAHGFLSIAFSNPRPEIVHAHLFNSSSVLACLCKLLLGIKTISKLGQDSVGGDVDRNLATPAGRLKLSLFKRGIDFFIAINSGIREELLGIGIPEGRILSISNGVDTENFRPAASGEKEELRRRNPIPFSRCAICLGSLIPRKRVDFLISIWPEVVKKFPDAGLLVVGDGEERDALERLAREKGIGDRVLFTGTVANPEDYLRSADIFIMPSRAEGVSNALLQAMSCALPVLVAENSGTRVLIENGVNGFVISPGDRDEAVRVIEKLFTSETVRARIGESARGTILQKFSIQTIAEQYETLYCELASSRREKGD
ncbi:MAG: glycosyltransferase family 4 protein [bacterium]